MADDVNISFEIVSPGITVEALRDSGYKSTPHALAELIDNSIEAKADLVEVFAIEEAGTVNVRNRYRVERIAVLDNGEGMDGETLRRSLRFGDGTRKDRRGMGRFGVGLPNSSVSQCERVDVWSWKNGPDNALHTWLDLDEVRSGRTHVPEPIAEALPAEWLGLSADISNSGTLVQWSRLDRVQWRGADATLANTEFLIGRIYRKFLINGQTEIRLVPVRNGKATEGAYYARPNDPLYLAEKTCTPSPFENQPMFETIGASSTGVIGEERFPIEIDDKEYYVTIRASIARDVARRWDVEDAVWPASVPHGNPGATDWGKHAARNQGISLIRAGRELDLDIMWVNSYDPTERWWGIEVEFPPALDEVFGVTNNKQGATIFSSLAKFDWEDEKIGSESFLDFKQRLAEEGDRRLPLIDIVRYLKVDVLGRIHVQLDEQTKGTRQKRSRHDEATVQADNAVKRRKEEGRKGLTDDLGEQKTEEEAEQEQFRNLTEVHHYTPADARRIIDETRSGGRSVNLVSSHQPEADSFFGVECQADLLQVSLNMDHPVYGHLIALLDGDFDGASAKALADRLHQASSAFKVLLYAWARNEDEQPDGRARERVRRVRKDWGMMAREFFEPGDGDD